MWMKIVVIFNLGGPDRLESVKPFLFNLFYDKSILNIPNPIRYGLAKLVSFRRTQKAKDIYEYLGGKSPIYTETKLQADALQDKLGPDYKVLVCMRYWHPMIEEVIEEIAKIETDEIILLPLYPQYSKSTTGSFYREFERIKTKKLVHIPIRKICCYPHEDLFIKAHQKIISDFMESQEIPINTRFLFSAHGLPKKNILQGDPYEEQIHISVNNILRDLPQIRDHVICYQSKVGPLEWLGPSTEQEIARAAKDNIPIVIVPISFVSENSETLYELDYQYRVYAEKIGLKGYYRVPALQDNPQYITSLSSMVLNGYQENCGAKRCQLNCYRQKVA